MEIMIHGAAIYYEQYGQGDKEVLLLHGWGCDTTLFAPITKALGQSMHVTVLDFPGHGKSGRPPEPWGVSEYAQMTLDFIKALNITPANIIAHSFGGRVALYMAANEPELVDRMIITGGAGIKKPQTPEGLKREQQYQRLKKRYERMKQVKIFGSVPDKLQQALRQKFGSRDYLNLDEEMRQTFVKVISLDLRPVLKDIKASTLLIWGDKDTETPIWMGETMAAEIPDAALITFEGGSHYAYIEQWQRFVQIALHFFTKE